MTGYKNLAAWQKSMLLVKLIYTITKEYPKEEIFSLTSQTKRAAVSIPANIAEGCGRRTKKDTLQFLYISRGSLYELETHLNIAVMIEILSEENFNHLSVLIDECLKILNGLINKYETDKSLQ
ncbi:MAG: four helix bundle protein [Chitinophaga sp.]|jgi:four helix bundle protein|nr:four helix bundle protein [Chitinophaga sp.]